LARAGYSVSAVACEAPAPTHWSRRCSDRLFVADPLTDEQTYVADLALALRRAPFAVLLPSTDVALFVVSKHRERLEPLARIGLPSHAAVEASLDKLVLAREAAKVGLDPPPGAACAGDSEAIAAARDLGFPVVVKPGRAVQGGQSPYTRSVVSVVDDEAALIRAVAGLEPPFLLQRYDHDQRVVSCSGVRTDSGLLATLTTKWHRTWPAVAGSASYSEVVPSPPDLVERVESLLAAIGFQGIFELEVLDLGGGRYGAIDLNPRLFGWLTLAVHAGANLPALWCDWLCDRNPAPAHASSGVRYRWEDGDARHSLWQLRRGNVRAAAAVLRPRRRVVHAFFELADPAPLPAEIIFVTRRKVRALLRDRAPPAPEVRTRG
jgi:predicted ATP-grasp superfamily ATP-dependent carboligase